MRATLCARVRGRAHGHARSEVQQTFLCIAAGAIDAWPLDAARAGLGEDRLLREFGV